ncbi:MAG: hydroxymethylbilane synthase [Pseudomonadota bacterium]
MDKPLSIATRQSPLALAQAFSVRAMLGRAANIDKDQWEEAFPLKTFVTIGDRNLQSSLADVGGKGLFVKEIEAALLEGEADIAVHSMKDMPAEMPPGLVQGAVPAREDPRDAFVTVDGKTIADLPQGSVIGTSSVRRAAQLLRMRPDLTIVPFRGNVATRLEKLGHGVAQGTFLAEAGLRRLGLGEVRRHLMPMDAMLPALGQAALLLQTRADGAQVLSLLKTVQCQKTALETAVERGFLAQLDGSCRTPMAGHATLAEGVIHFRAEILTPDGKLHRSLDELITLEPGLFDEQLTTARSAGEACASRLLQEAEPELRHALASR